MPVFPDIQHKVSFRLELSSEISMKSQDILQEKENKKKKQTLL